jgi:hypothetical protein
MSRTVGKGLFQVRGAEFAYNRRIFYTPAPVADFIATQALELAQFDQLELPAAAFAILDLACGCKFELSSTRWEKRRSRIPCWNGAKKGDA